VVVEEPVALLEGLGPWPDAAVPDAPPEPRLASQVALAFPGEDGPVLVLGRHGLGRTALLVPGAGGGLGGTPGDWSRWEGFAPAMARLVRGLAPAPAATPVDVVEVLPSAEGALVTLEVHAPRDVVVEAPDVHPWDDLGDPRARLPVARSGDSRFDVRLPAGPPAARTLAVALADGTIVPVVAFDPGVRPAAPDPGAPERLARAAGVTYVETALPAPPPGTPGPPRRVPLAPLLALASLLFLLADAAVRRTAAIP
jgi:hypothetical protein